MGTTDLAAIARRLAFGLAALGLSACTPASPPDAAAAAKPAPDQRAAGVIITPTGVVTPLLASFDGGSWVRTPCDNVAVVHGGRHVDRADIVLDPGHGGPEAGALSPNGEAEKVPNLAVAKRVARQLNELGISVVMTRNHDTSFMTLKTRAEIATALHPSAFVAIHHNAGTSEPSDRPGTESYHQIASDDGRRLAESIYDEVSTAMRRFDVPWVNPNPGVKSRRGEHGDYYGVLRMSQGVTSVIIEAAFMSNEPEAELLLRPGVQDAEADAITRGIVHWLRTEKTGVLLTEPNATPDPGVRADDADGCVDPPLQ